MRVLAGMTGRVLRSGQRGRGGNCVLLWVVTIWGVLGGIYAGKGCIGS